MKKRNTYMLNWWKYEIDYLILIIKSGKPFPNYYFQSLYDALEEYYYLKDFKKTLFKDKYIL